MGERLETGVQVTVLRVTRTVFSPYKSPQLYQSYGTHYNNGANLTAFRVSCRNPNLKWESTSMFNVGLDFQLFNSRLGGTILNTTKEDQRYAFTPIPF